MPEAQPLDQGPFSIRQDRGWRATGFTTPLAGALRNYGCGLVGYAWEEDGPALAVRERRRSLPEEIERLASLEFVDLLSIRCDGRDVQAEPGLLCDESPDFRHGV